MMNPQLTIALQSDKPLTAYGPLAAFVEESGFGGVSVYNDMLYQPAWYPLMEVARATSRIRVGPAAVNPFTCHPIHIASQTALLDQASGGRAYLGLARGAWLDFVGLDPKEPVTAMREAFECVRHLLSHSKEPYRGKIFPIKGGDALRWPIERDDIPFLLGSWGSKTISACIGQIQEIKIGGSANPAVIPHFQKILAAANHTEEQENRSTGLAIGAVTVVDEDAKAARTLAKREVALYLPIVAKLDPSLNLDPDLLHQIQEAANQYDFDRAAVLIADDLLTRFAFAGTPAQVAEQCCQLLDAGATRIEFGTPHGLSTQTGLRLLKSLLTAIPASY